MKKHIITVGLVQINERKEGMARSGHQRNSKNEIIKEAAIYPYSIGLLQAYAEKYYSNTAELNFLLPVYKRISIANAVEHLLEADIVGFSTYVWNINLSLEIARALKQKKPGTLIVFGGPHVPDYAEEFLKKYTFIDVVCHGEGEQVFLSILENYFEKDWSPVPSVSYLDPSGHFKSNPRKARTIELSEIPSPYLEGTFDALRDANSNTSWIMLWETNRGCPFSCTYCDWGSAVGTKVTKFDDSRLYRELDWFAKTRGDIIFCCDANYGMLPRDYELAEFAVLIKSVYKHPRILTVQNAKNATEKTYKVQKLLATSKLNPVVTLSVQSVNNKTLEAIKRKNISLETFRELQTRFTRDKVLTYTDVILGMPEETYDTFFEGISTIIEGGQHNRILFYNLSILPNAEMGNPDYQKKYCLKVVPQLIQNMHTHLHETEECDEYLDTVVETSAMPAEDWVRSKCVWWITEMLYYNFALKLPVALLRKVYNISYRKLLEIFLHPDETRHPVFFKLKTLMEEKAKEIQNGGKEFYPSGDWLNIYWTTEQYLWIDLINNNKVEEFYEESEVLFKEELEKGNISYNPDFIHQVCELNKLLMVKPNDREKEQVNVSWNLMEVFTGVINGEATELRQEEHTVEIDRTKKNFEDWLEHQIICQNSKCSYWYMFKSKSVAEDAVIEN